MGGPGTSFGGGRRCRLPAATMTLALAAFLVAACGNSSVLPSVSQPSIPTVGPTGSAVPATSDETTSATPSETSTATPTPATPGATPTPSPTPAGPTAKPVAAHWETVPGSVGLDNPLRVVRLEGGKVLALSDRRAALWNPKNERWRAVDGLNKSRSESALVALSDGRALVVGGTNNTYQSYSSAYLLEPSTGAWTKTGLMHAGRSLPTAVELADGRVLVAGGYFAHRPEGAIDTGFVLAVAHPGGASDPTPGPDDVAPSDVGRAIATAELFDPSTGTWSSTGSMRYARYGAATVRLADGRVLIVGSSPGPDSIGVDIDWRAFRTAELFDPATGRFSLTGSLPAIDVKALARQGAPGWVLDQVRGDSWPMPQGVGTLVALPDGDAILIGQTAWWKHVADFARSFRYDASRGTWSEIGDTWISIGTNERPYRTWTSSKPNLAGAMVAATGDGRILAAGGGESRVALAYVPRTGSWRTLPRLPEKLSWRSAGAVPLADGSVLVVNTGNRPSYRFVPRR